jgi:hypothetical protein
VQDRITNLRRISDRHRGAELGRLRAWRPLDDSERCASRHPAGGPDGSGLRWGCRPGVGLSSCAATTRTSDTVKPEPPAAAPSQVVIPEAYEVAAAERRQRRLARGVGAGGWLLAPKGDSVIVPTWRAAVVHAARRSSGPGQFRRPNGTRWSTTCLVVERDNRRVQVLALPERPSDSSALTCCASRTASRPRRAPDATALRHRLLP